MLDHVLDRPATKTEFQELCRRVWKKRVAVDPGRDHTAFQLACRPEELSAICGWLTSELEYVFATLVAEETETSEWLLTYVFYASAGGSWVHLHVRLSRSQGTLPSISDSVHAADWHEREIEDLFGLRFEGHPRLGDFVLHEEWPEGTNPMRRGFDARQPLESREPDPKWEAQTIVEAPGAFAMPIGPVYSDFAEAAHFLLETVGEDVIRTLPRFFYKYRGIEKIAEGQPVDRVLLLAERFSGTSAFAHGMAFCQAVETIWHFEVPPRARVLRTVLAELERLRHHVATITGICNSTALAVATSQAAILEEDLLRLTCALTGHRYFFGLLKPGGLAHDFSDDSCQSLISALEDIGRRLRELEQLLRYSSSFLDRIEEVGVVSAEAAISYGLVGPIARASGVQRDIRKLCRYGAYEAVKFEIPSEEQGDGYARLRVLFREAAQSALILHQLLPNVPSGEVATPHNELRPGLMLAAVEAPMGAAFHWLRLGEDGLVMRYRVTPPSFTNWHGFHLAAENFAFQDFPIILATFGLSNAECDR